MLGVGYASVVSNYLWTLEMLRFSLNPKLARFGEAATQKDIDDLKSVGATVAPHFHWEGKLFRWEMRLLWTTTGAVLIDIYFGKFLNRIVGLALLPILKHFGFS